MPCNYSMALFGVVLCAVMSIAIVWYLSLAIPSLPYLTYAIQATHTRTQPKHTIMATTLTHSGQGAAAAAQYHAIVKLSVCILACLRMFLCFSVCFGVDECLGVRVSVCVDWQNSRYVCKSGRSCRLSSAAHCCRGQRAASGQGT
jgi:hypothetical protein